MVGRDVVGRGNGQWLQSPFPSSSMGGDQVGLYDRHAGTPEIQLTTHRRGRLDQHLHVARDKERKGRRRP